MTHTGENTLFLVWSEKCNKYMSSWVRWRKRTEQNYANGHRVQCFFVLWVFTAAAVQQLLPSMSTLDTVVGGSFLVEACLPETGLQLVVVIQATFGSGSFFHIVGRGFLQHFLVNFLFYLTNFIQPACHKLFPRKICKVYRGDIFPEFTRPEKLSQKCSRRMWNDFTNMLILDINLKTLLKPAWLAKTMSLKSNL